MKLKKLFCIHNYYIYDIIKDSYCDGRIQYINKGWGTKITYKCKKCGKEKIKYVKEEGKE